MVIVTSLALDLRTSLISYLNRRWKITLDFTIVWTISNWVNHDSLSSYRRLLINGFFSQSLISIHILGTNRNKKKTPFTIYTFKSAHLFTAIVWKKPLFKVTSFEWIDVTAIDGSIFFLLKFRFDSIVSSEKSILLFIFRKRWRKIARKH